MESKQLNDTESFDETVSKYPKWDEKKHRFMQKIWWHRIYSDWYYDLTYGVKNLIRWFKIVWKDRDYDANYILYALLFKIQKTRELTERNQRHVGYEVDVTNMRRCEVLIENLIEDDYTERCGFDHDRVKIDWSPVKEGEFADHDMFQMDNIHENPQTEEELAEIFKNARDLLKSEKSELFTILDQNILQWWD